MFRPTGTAPSLAGEPAVVFFLTARNWAAQAIETSGARFEVGAF